MNLIDVQTQSKSRMMLKKAFLPLVATLVLFLSGCNPVVVSSATPTAVPTIKEVFDRHDAYFAENFSLANIDPATRSQVAAADNANYPFSSFTAEFLLALNKAGSGPQEFGISVTFTPIGSGLLQEIYSSSANGIPVYENMSVSYRGIISLRSQDFTLQGKNANQMSEVKQLTSFPSLLSIVTSDSPVVYSGESGYLTGTRRWKFTDSCVRVSTGVAIKLNTKLHGSAIEMICSQPGENGVIKTKRELTYLPDYGIALLNGIQDAGMVKTYKLIRVQVKQGVMDARLEIPSPLSGG